MDTLPVYGLASFSATNSGIAAACKAHLSNKDGVESAREAAAYGSIKYASIKSY